jgi:cyclic di-GMP phosphodiesterase Gmr
VPAGPAGRSGPGVVRLPGLADAFVAATPALVCVVDAEARVVMVNPALEAFTGRRAAELLGRRFTDLWVVPEHADLALDAVRRAIGTGRAHPQEGDWLDRSGARRRISMENAVLSDVHGRPYAVACIGLDVTERRREEDRLHERARTDLLTGLVNRGTLFEVLAARLAAGGCGLLFCDLDRFKEVNDRHGHAIGDLLLAEVGARLAGAVGADDVAARFGGDEFVVVTPSGDPDRLAVLSRRVVRALAAPYAAPVGTLSIGVSVGTAAGGPGDAADEVVARADRDMYGVKTSRRRREPRTAG